MRLPKEGVYLYQNGFRRAWLIQVVLFSPYQCILRSLHGVLWRGSGWRSDQVRLHDNGYQVTPPHQQGVTGRRLRLSISTTMIHVDVLRCPTSNIALELPLCLRDSSPRRQPAGKDATELTNRCRHPRHTQINSRYASSAGPSISSRYRR